VALPDRLHRPDLTRVEVYGDESLKRGGYDLLGALSLSAAEAADLRRAIVELRAGTSAPNPQGEMKWTKCSGATENPLFAGAIDLVMGRIRRGKARFKCIVIDRALVDNDAWNGGDQELGFYKAWQTLLFSMVDPGLTYHVRLDARQLQKASRLDDLKNVLNARGLRDRKLDYRCCHQVEGADSKKDDLIQVADLLTGAIGFHYAGGDGDPKASPGKVAIADRIARHLRKRDLRISSPASELRFNVWRWRPSRPKVQKGQTKNAVAP
jgi:hypothetical protein